MIAFPNAKINLGLYITGKRSDGYHNLETVFYPLPQLRDALEITPAAEASLHREGLPIAGSPQDDLVWKAWKALQERFPERCSPVAIHLLKAIPMGAGLGGGSADAAFMLQLLNNYFDLGLSTDTLAAVALELGSDCPFFLYNTPQFARGRGEELQPCAVDLSGYSLQVVCPPIHVSTAAAFRMIRPRPAPFDLRDLASLPLTEWKGNVQNDFEAPVFEAHPSLARVREELYAAGAIYASMSGSGSAVYGIFQPGVRAATELTSFYFESAASGVK